MAKSATDFNLYQCNPGTLRSTRTTCLPQPMLERLRDEWNRRYPAARIPASIKRKETLWSALRDRMRRQYECASEYCAVRKLADPTDAAAAASFFRPPKPTEWLSRPREWHDTDTIARVMEQYEVAYPHFEFIGPVPIDFDERPEGSFGRCIVDELCAMDLAVLKERGDWAVGIVFNLDPHDRPGSHWVCAFLDLRAGAAYYYDSYGYPPPPEVRRLLRRCRAQGCRQIYWNDIRHQRKDTECGTYCMYVIIGLLKGRSFADICRRRVDDDTMNAIRDLLYATERPSSTAVAAARARLLML